MVFFILAIESLKVCFFNLTQESDEFFYIFFWGGGKDIENGLDFAKRSAIPNFIFIC